MSQDGTAQLNAAFHRNLNLAPSLGEFEAFLAQLKKNPHQPQKWRRLIDLAQGSAETEKIKTAYEALLQQYPNTAAAQISYIQHYLNTNPRHPEAVELFKRFIKPSPSVEFIRFYLNYIRRVHADPTHRDLNKREIIRQAYDYALGPPNGVGQDIDSGDIWRDYIEFLSDAERSATSSWERQQDLDALRKVYQRAVQIPINNVERLWEDYEDFEHKQNKNSARKYLSDLSQAHMQARMALRQVSSHVNGVYPPVISDLYLPLLPTFTLEDRIHTGKWKAYLKWEEGNPLQLEEKDKRLLVLRIQTVYQKALTQMRFYPEIWFMAYLWTKAFKKPEQAKALLVNGREANPQSHLLAYAYIDELEGLQKYEDAEIIYDEFIASLRADLEMLEECNKTKVTAEIAENQELNDKKEEYTLVYINYMRFLRRSKSSLEAREIFDRAQSDKWVTWHVYEAAAMLECFTREGNTLPTNIFKAAYLRFPSEAPFVVCYLKYLITLKDDLNARAVFETSVTRLPADVARPIWELWADHEYHCAHVETILKLQKRMADIYPNDTNIKRFAMKHKYLTIDSIASRDIGFSMARKEESRGQKRATSPEIRRRDDYVSGAKRPRVGSPPRERWASRSSNTYHEHVSAPRREQNHQPMDVDVKSIVLPPVLNQLLGQLPPSSGVEGSVLNVDESMGLLKSAAIPSPGARLDDEPIPRGGGMQY